MDSTRVSAALRERLGDAATAGLLQLFNDARREWMADVMAAASDRFERRLVEEASKLHAQMTAGLSGIRQEMAELRSDIQREMSEFQGGIRQAMEAGAGALRQELVESRNGLQRELAELRSSLSQQSAEIRNDLRTEMADQRFELLKWAFLFWVGQFFAVASLVAVVVRFLRTG